MDNFMSNVGHRIVQKVADRSCGFRQPAGAGLRRLAAKPRVPLCFAVPRDADSLSGESPAHPHLKSDMMKSAHESMSDPALPPGTTQRTLAIIMGGGAGTRLFPLTKERAKPAVPLGGKYRLVDIPISNCINGGFSQIYVLTQFNSTSLHRHINASYKFDHFSKSFVEILAAQQTPEGATWYQGTADAVRQNLRDFLNRPYEYFLILSGDQLYRMDYLHLLQEHLRTGADITLGTTPVDRQAASAFGIMHSDANRRIYRFEEKPKDPALLDELRIPPELLAELGL